MGMIAPLQIKAPLQEVYVWDHWLPGLVDVQDPDDFSLTLRRGSTTYTPEVAEHYATRLTVTNIGQDLRTLTIDPGEDPVANPAGGLAGSPHGRALLSSTSHGDIPVTIVEVQSTTSVLLADPLPRGWTATGGAWLVYTGIRSAWTGEDVTSAVGRLSLRMAYSYARRGEASATREVVTGTVKVCRQPFTTGLTHHSLIASALWLSSQVPRGQQSWEPQIVLAQAMLEGWIRETLADHRQGADEDDLSGAPLHGVHAGLTAYLVLQSQTQMGSNRADAREDALKAARTEYDRVMKNIPWLDLNGDGLIGDGETDLNLQNSVAGKVGGYFTRSNMCGFKRFTRHQAH